MKKELTIKLENFSVKAKKLVVDEILDIAEDVAKHGYLDGFAVILEQAKDKGWLKTIQDNRQILTSIADTALIFPEGKTIGSIYPEELITLFPAIMEVNDGFLEVMEVSQLSKTKDEKIAPSKSSKTSDSP